MTNDPDLDDCAFLSGKKGRMKDCQTSLQCKYFFNYLIGFTSLTSLFLSCIHLQQLITFTVFAFTFFDQVANRAAGDRRAPESRSARNVAPSWSPALCSAPFCWRPSSLPTPDPRTVGCALCKYICFSVAFQFAFFVILFHYLSFFFCCNSVTATTGTTTRALACFVYMHYMVKCTDSSDTLYDICALCTRMLSVRWGKILQG